MNGQIISICRPVLLQPKTLVMSLLQSPWKCKEKQFNYIEVIVKLRSTNLAI